MDFLDMWNKGSDLSNYKEKVGWLCLIARKGISYGKLAELSIEFDNLKEHYKERWDDILFETNPVHEIFDEDTIAIVKSIVESIKKEEEQNEKFA